MKFSTIAATAFATFAGLTALPAGAQTSVTTTTQAPMTTGSVTIAPEKQTVIRQHLGTTKPIMMKEKVTVGSTVPESVELHTVPDTVVSDVPTVKGYSYFVHDKDVVLVDPQTRKVVTIIQ